MYSYVIYLGVGYIWYIAGLYCTVLTRPK